jgi:PAS domain-containing protein
LQSIYPDEIKFLFRYGNFLLHIIHNEYDALENFRQAQNIYQSNMSKKGNAMPINEQTIFGENSSSAIILISATSSRIGTVVHANEDVESVLGFKRQELIGKNITLIIPRPIAKAHDKLV